MICVFQGFEAQAGKIFLIGTIPKGSSESNWDANKIGAILWDQVRNYVVFDSLEEITNAIKISEEFQEEDEKNT